MKARRAALLKGLLVTAALLASPSALAEVRIGLGGDYWFNQGGLFNLTLAIDTRLIKQLSIGGRFGAMLTTAPNTIGVPVDLDIRAHLGERIYLEALVGPWIFFGANPFRAHAALGFGLETRNIQFGIELGWVDPAPIIGLRVAWRI